MCVIVASPKGVRQPTKEQLRNCFRNNPHGAGYMFARDGRVIIHKGFMEFNEFMQAVDNEHLKASDAVVYHFRISTQGGIIPELTHPFPLAKDYKELEKLDSSCEIGLAHNGIIRLTSGTSQFYSDTEIFITQFMTRLIRNHDDVASPAVKTMIATLTNSKWAILDGLTEEIVTVGKFENVGGRLFSNNGYLKNPIKHFILHGGV